MAGSQSNQPAPFVLNDPVLTARVEAIKQLAGGLSDHVAVIDRNFNVVYANESAWAKTLHDGAGPHSVKCYEVCAHRSDTCDSCSTTKFFESQDVRSVSCTSIEGAIPRDLHQAFPLASSRGDVELILVLFKHGTIQK